MARVRSIGYSRRPAIGWRSQRARARRQPSPPVSRAGASRASLRLPLPLKALVALWFLVAAYFVSISAVLLLIPSAPIVPSQLEGIDVSRYWASLSAGIVIALAIGAGKSRNGWWTAAVVALGVTNVLGVPWIVCVILEVPAIASMPPLMFSCWASIAAVVSLLAVKLGRIEPRSITGAVVGGSVGLAGLALLTTQFATSSFGHEVTIPILQKSTVTPVLPSVELQKGDTRIAVRYDDGLAQQAYFDRGFMRVARPAYFSKVEKTITHDKAPQFDETTGDVQEGFYIYRDAMQSILTLNLVRSQEAGFQIGQSRIPGESQ